MLRHMYSRVWDIYNIKIQGHTESVKFLRSKTFQDISSKVKNKLLHLALPTSRKDT